MSEKIVLQPTHPVVGYEMRDSFPLGGKHYRRIATRYDKTAESFLAALKLVAVRIWLRDNESTS